MRTTFTRSLEELTERYRRKISSLPLAKGMSPLDTSGIHIRSDVQIRDTLRFIGMLHHFEVNHWFSFVSWSREADDPNKICIVVEGEGPDFETTRRAIADEL